MQQEAVKSMHSCAEPRLTWEGAIGVRIAAGVFVGTSRVGWAGPLAPSAQGNALLLAGVRDWLAPGDEAGALCCAALPVADAAAGAAVGDPSCT